MPAAECLFCRIANRTLPAEIVGEAEGLLAFKDIHPQAPTHLLIIPLEHIPSLADLTPAHTTLVGQGVQFATRLAREHQLVSPGYRLVINCGAGAGQSVWHLHWHLLGGRPLRWPPG
jgi:histidine triad (HIT) family protein